MPRATYEEWRADPENADAEWQDFAHCIDKNPDLFFSDKQEDIDAAKQICRACVVREECLETALTSADGLYPPAVWGGMSPRELKRLRRQRVLAKRSDMI